MVEQKINIMEEELEEELEKKIKDLKEFIKEKTDQGTANYMCEEIREICGLVDTLTRESV